MSRCIRDGVSYARHRNKPNDQGKLVCAACGHTKGTKVDVTPEVSSDSAQTPINLSGEVESSPIEASAEEATA